MPSKVGGGEYGHQHVQPEHSGHSLVFVSTIDQEDSKIQ